MRIVVDYANLDFIETTLCGRIPGQERHQRLTSFTKHEPTVHDKENGTQ